MLKKELVRLIENAKDDEEIDGLVANSDLAKSLTEKGLTLDAFKGKLQEKDFKAFMESENDKYYNKALKTWKENNLEKELEPFIKEKYPELITDPMQKKLLELEKQLADEKAANARKDLLAEAMKYAKDTKIPAKIIEKCLGEDFDKTKEEMKILRQQSKDKVKYDALLMDKNYEIQELHSNLKNVINENTLLKKRLRELEKDLTINNSETKEKNKKNNVFMFTGPVYKDRKN